MLRMTYIIYIVTICYLIGDSVVNSGPTQKLPKHYKKCKRNDPDLNNCLKAAIKGILPELVKGIPSLGVWPLDPLSIQNLQIKQGSGPVSIDLTFININMTGIRSLTLKTVDANWDKYSLDSTGDLSEPIILEGDYNIDGKVLILPISGTGKCKLTLDDVQAAMGLRGKELVKDKKVHMDVEKFDFRFNTTKLHLYFGNLFNGDKALGDNMNTFLNQNWDEILKELKPAIEEALGEAFREISNRVFHKVPFNQIVLD
ncbi:hypothetical protein LSTR_LSTR007663 [Laodelphax striatellus]|uniref:Uncharacterized protein n=1 Tax=Laodelphax striatellus TaxID=195883 RepID=A0A482WIN0_LAOST|nr:hypothetical protein LSTR_LSTR007663 [Laodelphax striatellus]